MAQKVRIKMSNAGIILAGVGGQGLVLTTRIISEAALKAGLDVKSNDVIGLSQRGGKIYGSVRMGEKVNSPNIGYGEADCLLAFEALEAKRLVHYLKKDGLAIVNRYEMAPSLVQQEEMEYDQDVEEVVRESAGEFIYEDFTAMAKHIGHVAVANIFMLGIASERLPISREHWEAAIRENVPEKSIELNLEAFRKGAERDF